MSAPVRWLASSDVPVEARALLSAAKPSRRMTSPERRRSLGRVTRLVSLPVAASLAWAWAKVAIAAVGGVTVVIAVAGKAAPMLSAPAAPAVVGALEPGALRQRVAKSLSAPRIDATASTAAPLPAASAAPPSRDGAVSVSTDARETSDTTGPGAHARSPSAPTTASPGVDPLRREAQLLEGARARLESDPAGALAFVDEHARAFPNGQLRAERELLRTLALRRLGRDVEASSRGRALIGTDDGQLYEQRVRHFLDSK